LYSYTSKGEVLQVQNYISTSSTSLASTWIIVYQFSGPGGVLKYNQQSFGLRPAAMVLLPAPRASGSKARADVMKHAFAHILTTLSTALLQKSLANVCRAEMLWKFFPPSTRRVQQMHVEIDDCTIK